MNKKGVDNIVATVLLILLVLVMVFVIWFFIRGFTQSGSEQIPYSSQCLKIGVEPVSCIYTQACQFLGAQAQGNVVVGIRMRRTSEPGTLSGLAFLFEDANENTRRVDNIQSATSSALPREGEYALSGFMLNGSFVPVNVNVASILGAQKHVCQFTSSPVTCFSGEGQFGTCADQNKDGEINVLDIGAFLVNYNNQTLSYPYGDINGDGLRNSDDPFVFCVSYNMEDTSGCP